MAGELFKQEQKFQQPIQVTKEEEQFLKPEQLQQEKQEYGQQQVQAQEQAMTMASSQILKSDKFSDVDDSDPSDPAMEFADEQQREWYDRRNAAKVEKAKL